MLIEVRFLQSMAKNKSSPGGDKIVEYIEHLKFRGHLIIVFELLHLNLFKFIRNLPPNKSPFTNEHFLKSIVFQITQALNFLKQQKVIHCDLKPENIVFKHDTCQQIKIIDFGASCRDYKSGFFYVQSRFYRAPEIVLGCPYGHAADMWSFGCIVFELIHGRPLFPARDENELIEYMMLTSGELPS